MRFSDEPRWRSCRALPVLSAILCTGCFVPNVNLFKPASMRATRPNIVVILADDMGYGDVRAQNPDSTIATPHLDRLAREGMRFTDAHTPSAVCTPTRYGLLTGRYAWRTRLKSGVLNGYGKPLIQAERITLPEHLATQGYATSMVGKWHLGLGFARQEDVIDYSVPISDGAHTHGFQSSYIIPASLDFPPYVYIENGQVTALPTIEQPASRFPGFLRKGPRSPDLDMEGCLDHLCDQATESIRRLAGAEQPFFLYFALTAPHKPVLPHARFQGRSGLGPYGDFVVQVDDTVGRVLDAIDAAGIRDETLVIYTSDNGSFMYRTAGADHVEDPEKQAYRPAHHTPNGELRGTKADIWEAGHRVPFLARWPLKIKAGATADRTVCLTDLFATCAELAGAAPAAGAAPDSTSLVSVLAGNPHRFDREPVIHHSASGMFAIRDGRWKLVLGNGSGGREQPKGKPFERPYALFDLHADPAERTNVIGQHPEVATRLEQTLLAIRDRDV